uniref:GSKIP domain-containing protein n=1 Tax=Lotharella oceanica TaxID=641309 RepID=A0A7S2TNU0_9EUKA|mmetsp:Transcript_22794/g.42839  ORF Transcript_22794/g.42839 Transcript_22794/m.42839 type:complete len:135 (+) Transcript_22794:45-449(+)|eukprot:CAMPEP_0170174510 /NCGR_PEP_ID=MMETSP0040_2-20121228/7740_1 /TAXON_ID=641309 /ORGANISM="Lotharella oceanica, Strain CCMP622" /LENGTH=134 /DNA_ID=CAMNT_0010416183 /DNA_START=40 /DNA_END=444 /DNA_ORIENTATION=-
MNAEAVKEEIDASVSDVKFACESKPKIQYFEKERDWMKSHRVQAVVSVQVKGLEEMQCAACFPFGYALVKCTEDGKFDVNLKDSDIHESLHGLLCAKAKGYEELFNARLQKQLLALQQTEGKGDADVGDRASLS